MTNSEKSIPHACPCGSGKTYAHCCKPFHLGLGRAPTAEALMRSRYSAFAVGNAAYLIATHAPEKSADIDPAHLISPECTWTGLEIVDTQSGQIDDTTGFVEFIAHFSENDTTGCLHEKSCFEKRDGQWLYVDGVFMPGNGPATQGSAAAKLKSPALKQNQIGRNDPCPCGSGKKFKKCCGAA